MIVADSVLKKFTQGTTEICAVNQVSFQVEKGKTLAIVGPSGSGKTTLLSLLAGLDRPDGGEITISGQALSALNEEKLSHFRGTNMGIVFQQFHLMPQLTALENVCLPLDIHGVSGAQEKALKALEDVGLKDRAHHLPNQLSGGECQRVAIARATVVEPKILFADEPSGNLDTETGKKVSELLFDLVAKKQMTMILVTHDLELASRCDSMIRIEGGVLH